MAITSGVMTVGTVASIIDGTFNSNFRLIVHNNDNTDAVFIGGPDVTIANGFVVKKEESIQLEMNPLESVYAVSGKAGHTISYLKQV
ncbi:hypothetical protein UFOVP692_46 [uncultured Caudovirales phage]|jgi:hypothetical protein|uniref:Uncharacterized protein n=1 Tax=uncultured Caudovirales phage TaxID=2100421 RepID=A0A6J5NGH3_9CAUD|nr:hypothetical protein UFOVP692_46 [uncultured Caudovirales phage]